MKSLLKLLGRIALILAAALLVVGITSLINPTTLALGAAGQNPQLPAGLPRSQGGAGMGLLRGRGGAGGGGHASAGLNLLETGELGSHTAQIALLMVPFAAWSTIARRRRNSAVRMRDAELPARQ